MLSPLAHSTHPPHPHVNRHKQANDIRPAKGINLHSKKNPIKQASMSGLSISPTEKTQELLSAAKDLALEHSNTQVRPRRLGGRVCGCLCALPWCRSVGRSAEGEGRKRMQGCSSLPTTTSSTHHNPHTHTRQPPQQVTPLHVAGAMFAEDNGIGASVVRTAGFQNLDALRQAIESEMARLPRQSPPPTSIHFDSAMEGALVGAAQAAKKKGDAYLAA